ncbi:hypothetical protein Bca4012_095337 [Brassica carinata]
MNSNSRMGAVYSLIVREEEILMEQRRRDSGGSGFVVRKERDEDIELVVPPVFSFCTKVVCFRYMIILLLCLRVVYFFSSASAQRYHVSNIDSFSSLHVVTSCCYV